MTVNVESAGNPQNPTIIFVHGAGGSAATWFLQLKSISKEFHVVAIELNGHGKSPDRKEKDTTNSYLRDIKQVVENYEKPVLAGHSMGGMLSQLFALQYPELLSGIILIGTGAKLRVMPAIFEMLETNFEGYVSAAGDYMFHEGASRKLIESSMIEIRKCKPEIISRDFAACNDFDIMDSVSTITLPTLILVGKQDLMTPMKYSEFLHARIPNSILHIIDNAGHSVMLEQPSILNSHISAWMKSLKI